MLRTRGGLCIFTCKCASRYSGAPFFHIRTSKSAPNPWFCTFSVANVLLATAACHFYASERQKVFRGPSVLYIFTCNVLLATAACRFFASERQKVLQGPSALCIFTCKCASRHSGVPFFRIRTSKSAEALVFCAFSLANVLLATTVCHFSTLELQKVLRDPSVFVHFHFKMCISPQRRAILISPVTTDLRTRRFNRPTFRLTRHTNH